MVHNDTYTIATWSSVFECRKIVIWYKRIYKARIHNLSFPEFIFCIHVNWNSHSYFVKVMARYHLTEHKLSSELGSTWASIWHLISPWQRLPPLAYSSRSFFWRSTSDSMIRSMSKLYVSKYLYIYYFWWKIIEKISSTLSWTVVRYILLHEFKYMLNVNFYYYSISIIVISKHFLNIQNPYTVLLLVFCEHYYFTPCSGIRLYFIVW